MKVGKAIHIILIALIVAIAGCQILLNNKKIQQDVADYASYILAKTLQTEIEAESFRITHPCGISIGNLLIDDHLGDTLLFANNATVQFRILSLIKGKLDITRVNLINPYINIYQQDSGSATNLEIVLSHLVSDEKKEQGNSVTVRANSIYVKNGRIEYNMNSLDDTPAQFNLSHILLDRITTRLSLKHLSSDSINARLRNLSFVEQSGLVVSEATGAVRAGKENLLLNNFSLSTQNSNLAIDHFEAVKIDSNVIWNTQILSSVRGSDFVSITPGVTTLDHNINISFTANGDSQRYNISNLSINSIDNIFNFGITASLTNHSNEAKTFSVNNLSFENCNINGEATNEFYNLLTGQLAGFNITVPDFLETIGNFQTDINLSGKVSNFTADATVTSEAGDASISISNKNDIQSLAVTGNGLELGKLLKNNSIGKSSIELSADGRLFASPSSGNFSGSIEQLFFNQYTYNNICLEGNLINDTIKSTISFTDPNADILAKFNIFPAAENTYTWLYADIDNLNLTNLNFSARDSMIVSAKLTATGRGNELDLLRGEVLIDSVLYADSEGNFQTDRELLLTIKENQYNRRDVSLRSNIANIDIVGDYRLSTLPSSLAFVLEKSLPTLSEWLLNYKSNRNLPHITANNFLIDAQLLPTEFYKNVLHIPLEINSDLTLQCNINETNGTAHTALYIPNISYNDNYVRNGIIDLNSDNGETFIEITGSYSNYTIVDNYISIDLSAKNDSLDTNIKWQSIDKDHLQLNLSAQTIFEEFNNQEKWLKSSHQIKDSEFSYSSTNWDISDFFIATDSGKISLNNFNLANNEQNIHADGIISADSTDILDITLNNINIEELFSMLNAKDASFSGMASADISAISLLKDPTFYGNITADNFSFLGSYGGRLDAEGIWNKEEECIDINATMYDQERTKTILSGQYTPKDRYIDILIDANNTDLYFLNTFTKNIFREVKGNAFGKLRLFGALDALDLEGTAILENGVLDQGILNTRFIIKHDTLTFKPGKMHFRNVDFYDEFDNKGLLMCDLSHTYLNDFSANMNANITNMQVLNIPRTESTDIFANVFATGSINLSTSISTGLIVNADATTAPGTTFGYNLSAGPVADNSFLRIIDANSDTSEVVSEVKETRKRSKRKEEINTDVQLNFSINCTEDAIIELLMEPLNGTVQGSGQIRAGYSNKQGVNLLGRYNVSRGLCNLSLESLIRKEFKFSESNSSHVTFNGHPSTTELNLHTYHTVNSASLSDLDVNLSSDNNIRVNCLMDISGTVLSPALAFNIELPQGTQEEKEAIKSSTSTEEQTNLQFMYLLTMGRFYSYDYANAGTTTSPGTVESFFNNTINTQINNLLSQVVNNNNFSLSSNVTAGSYLNNDPANLTDKELEGILEAHLLNNRLLINGNFGYRENAMTNTSNFIGDIEVEWLMIKKPKISLRGYNKRNDKYFSKTSLNTQGVGIAYEADF